MPDGEQAEIGKVGGGRAPQGIAAARRDRAGPGCADRLRSPPAGHILNGEVDASDRLKVSRTAYREAVRILAAKGLVESRPKVGTRVSPPERWHLLDPDVLSWIFEQEPDDRPVERLVRAAPHRRAASCRARCASAGREAI